MEALGKEHKNNSLGKKTMMCCVQTPGLGSQPRLQVSWSFWDVLLPPPIPIFWDRASSQGPGWSQTHCGATQDLEVLVPLPLEASQICTAIHSHSNCFAGFMCTLAHSSNPAERRLSVLTAINEMGKHGHFYLLYKWDCPPKGRAGSHWS